MVHLVCQCQLRVNMQRNNINKAANYTDHSDMPAFCSRGLTEALTRKILVDGHQCFLSHSLKGL